MEKTMIELTDETFKSTVAEGVTVVDVWAEWCGPCRALAPTMEQLANELDGKATVAKLNTEDGPETCAELTVRTIPQVLVFKDGELKVSSMGRNAKDIMKDVEPLLDE
jgi:thioredoxin 1